MERWNRINLTTHGVMFVSGTNILFVDADHPVMHKLRSGMLYDGIYYKVKACDFYRECALFVESIQCIQRQCRRWLQARRHSRNLALAMALHGRLGAGSGLSVLGAADIFSLIAQ